MMPFRVPYLISIPLFCLSTALGQDYCTVCPDHTMCLFEGDGEACRPKLASGVGSKEIQEILDVHNYYRRRLARGQEEGQPSAYDMVNVVWDEEVACIAQRWADQCTYSHDTCRDLPNVRVGQIIRHTRSTRTDVVPEWNRTITSWYSEVSLWTPPSNSQPFRTAKDAGHFTQLAWAETSTVGCGYSVYPKSQRIEKLYVCNYASRGGNIAGDTGMNQQEPSRSACPLGTSCRDELFVKAETSSPDNPSTCWPGTVLYNGECLGYNDIVMAFTNAMNKLCVCNS